MSKYQSGYKSIAWKERVDVDEGINEADPVWIEIRDGKDSEVPGWLSSDVRNATAGN